MPRDLPQRNVQPIFMTCVWCLKYCSTLSNAVIKTTLTLPLKAVRISYFHCGEVLLLFHALSQYCASFWSPLSKICRAKETLETLYYLFFDTGAKTVWIDVYMMFWNSSSGNVLVRTVCQCGKRSHECSRSVSGPLPGFLQLCLWGMDEEEPAAGGEVPLGSLQQPVGAQHGGDEEPTG